MQLLASFLYILTEAPNKDIDSGVLQDSAKLKEEAKRLGESLCNLDKQDGQASEDTRTTKKVQRLGRQAREYDE